MSRQDKATTERHAKMLKELVRRPENKVCADCKRNDPRWASWNIGVFLCIRCSGIHRSMGTHISKVKSVDLDIWTPEQMQSIMKWGNQRANAYWEAHLKPGHIPPDHKIESFIRSKYDSRRWAMEGPPPADPSVLDNAASAAPAPVEQVPPAPQPSTQPPPQQRRPQAVQQQPQPHQLLSVNQRNQQPAPVAQPAVQVQAQAPAPAAPQQPMNDLFSLDFHAPSPPPSQTTAQSSGSSMAKNDILSLFSAAPAATTQIPAAANVWGQPAAAAAPQQPQQPVSMMGTSGAGMWGASSGWTAPQQQQAQPAFGQFSQWGQTNTTAPTAPLSDPFGNVWGNSGTTSNGGTSADLFGSSSVTTQKKDDVFGDLWGSSR